MIDECTFIQILKKTRLIVVGKHYKHKVLEIVKNDKNNNFLVFTSNKIDKSKSWMVITSKIESFAKQDEGQMKILVVERSNVFPAYIYDSIKSAIKSDKNLNCIILTDESSQLPCYFIERGYFINVRNLATC